MDTKRKRFTAEEKVKLLRLHLVEKEPVSDICDQYGFNPNVFYHWQKQFFENGTAAFEQAHRGRKDGQVKRKVQDSWAEPDIRDEVIDYVRYWSEKTEIKATQMIQWIEITRSKYYNWRSRLVAMLK